MRNAPDALQQRFVRAFERMQDWEQAQLVASLERVAAMLDAVDIDASPVLTTGEIHTGDRPGDRPDNRQPAAPRTPSGSVD